jgi:two-component system, OmpR family, phosphate regulon sensor histidine kinase PhoR
MVPFPEQENQLYDLKVSFLARTYLSGPQNIVILEVSREDFDYLKEFRSPTRTSAPRASDPWRNRFEDLRVQFLWNEKVYEYLLGRILQQDPEKVIVSFFFQDSLLIPENSPGLQGLARNPKVLWASQFDMEHKLLKPSPELTGTENYGFVNLHPDSDGVVRRAHLIHRNHISLPYRALQKPNGSMKTSLPLSESFLIGFEGGPGHFPACGVREFMKGQTGCSNLRGKKVIISPTGALPAGATLYRTPVGSLSRGEALANVIHTAEKLKAHRTTPWPLLFLLVLLHCLALGAIVLQQTGSGQAWRIPLLLAAELLLSLLLLRFASIHLSLLPFVSGALISYSAFLWLKFSRQESKRWQAEKRTQLLRELDELKSNFVSLMSHDLKTPLAKVQMLTERLARENANLSGPQKDIVTGIQKSNDELGQYIVKILNFQRIESQEIRLNKKSHDLNQLIEEVVERLKPLAIDRSVSLSMELEPMFALELDETLIRQVLTNLIDNAIKYTPPGSKVEVKSRDSGDFVEVEVLDNGPGLRKEEVEKLFKKFSRSEKTTAERVKGTGLGLYLVKYFIELHGGSTGVESSAEKGSRFWFRLPVHGSP